MNLEKYLKDSLTWDEYISHIKNTIESGDKSDDKYQYYSLNLARTERLLKKTELNNEQKEKLSKLKKEIILIAISEGWCGDAAQILPVVETLVKESDKLSSVVVLRDSNDLIDSYLTNGGKAVPIIIGVDKNTKEEIFKWGPRPLWATPILKEYKANKINHEQFGLELQKRYNKDKGNSIINELLEKLLE